MGVGYRMEDPWGMGCLTTVNYSAAEFEDNFVLGEHLPDSKQYLEVLERKLAKLKSQSSNAKNLLKALAQTKESHLERIIDSNSTDIINDQEGDEPVPSSSLKQFIAPEKQANTANELYELIKYDQLGQLFEKLEIEKEKKESK